MWPNPPFPADLVRFFEEIYNGKLVQWKLMILVYLNIPEEFQVIVVFYLLFCKFLFQVWKLFNVLSQRYRCRFFTQHTKLNFDKYFFYFSFFDRKIKILFLAFVKKFLVEIFNNKKIVFDILICYRYQ